MDRFRLSPKSFNFSNSLILGPPWSDPRKKTVNPCLPKLNKNQMHVSQYSFYWLIWLIIWSIIFSTSRCTLEKIFFSACCRTWYLRFINYEYLKNFKLWWHISSLCSRWCPGSISWRKSFCNISFIWESKLFNPQSKKELMSSKATIDGSGIKSERLLSRGSPVS